MNYFDVTASGFTWRTFFEEKLGVITITDVQLQSQTYGGRWFPGGTISVNGVPVLGMSYVGTATNSFYFSSVGDTFVGMTGNGLPASSQRLTGKAEISVDVTLYRSTDGTHIYDLKGSVTIDLTSGVVYIGDEAYMPYIGNGTSWDEYGSHKGNGTSFEMCGA